MNIDFPSFDVALPELSKFTDVPYRTINGWYCGEQKAREKLFELMFLFRATYKKAAEDIENIFTDEELKLITTLLGDSLLTSDVLFSERGLSDLMVDRFKNSDNHILEVDFMSIYSKITTLDYFEKMCLFISLSDNETEKQK
ncbi:hypothetical protein [Aquamicrobium sp.]|uniref:hypothetical protein n=1 Tax=Aquamicrobium sp. TaxID=1872579 RepID=UPI002589DA54|nr:hypothetical protein [Aquamicrobium sp.]MCK9549311.1 hypothetical protein [Aquamicrobium sp.]